MFSSLRMADGLLFAHELDRTRRTAEHVVLSACELGLATVRPGDEALGLTSVLLRLGSRSIVAGVARVNDEVAADVMTDYHRRLAGGADSAQALADAIAATHEVAPFVCFGSAWHA
jgi:CHAT domain-containing protein